MSRRVAARLLLCAMVSLSWLGVGSEPRAHTGGGAPPLDACGGHTDKKGTYHCHKKGCEACHAKTEPKPAEVQIVAFPGGEIHVDGKQVGYDFTGVLKLKPGSHVLVVRNRFLGEKTQSVELTEGQTGKIVVNW